VGGEGADRVAPCCPNTLWNSISLRPPECAPPDQVVLFSPFSDANANANEGGNAQSVIYTVPAILQFRPMYMSRFCVIYKVEFMRTATRRLPLKNHTV